MTAGDLVVVLSALLLTIGFAALIVVLLRVLDTLRDLRAEVNDLRAETRPLIQELRLSAEEARDSVDEARHDLERFDRVLGSAEAIGDAVGSRVTKTAFSSPSIKAAGMARGFSRTVARLRGEPKTSDRLDLERSRSVIELESDGADTRSERRRKRA